MVPRSLPEIVRKDFVADQIDVATDGSRQATFTISSGAVDRSGDTIDPKGWDLGNYLKNPVVLLAHNSYGLPIAKAISVEKSASILRATIEWPKEGVYDVADTTYAMVKGGFLKGASVGFKPRVRAFNEDRHGYDFQEQELLEFSLVAVPDNPECLAESVKALSAARDAGIDLSPIRKALDLAMEKKEAETPAPPEEAPKSKAATHLDKAHKAVSAAAKCIRSAHPYAKGADDIEEKGKKPAPGDQGQDNASQARKLSKAHDHLRMAVRSISRVMCDMNAEDETYSEPDDGFDWPDLPAEQEPDEDDSKGGDPAPVAKAAAAEFSPAELVQVGAELLGKKVDDAISARVNKLRGRLD